MRTVYVYLVVLFVFNILFKNSLIAFFIKYMYRINKIEQTNYL